MSDPYVFAINDGDGLRWSRHTLVADKLISAGYNVGLMLWTQDTHSMSDENIRKNWEEAMNRAGITKIERSRDERKGREWFRVYPRPDEALS